MAQAASSSGRSGQRLFCGLALQRQEHIGRRASDKVDMLTHKAVRGILVASNNRIGNAAMLDD